MAMGPNPLDEPNPFAVGAPPMPMPMVPQGQTPLGNLAGLAGKIAPFFIPGVPPLAATLNAMGVNNPLLLSAIMQNAPGAQAQTGSGLEGFGSLRSAAAGQMYQDPYNFAVAPPEVL